MKKYCIVIILFATFLSKTNISYASINVRTLPTDTIITQLLVLNLAQYQGKPVDSLIAHLPQGYITMKIGGWHSQRLAEVLYVIYPKKVSLDIHVRNFQYMNPHLVNTSNPTQNWDVTLFRKETIYYAIAFNASTCFNGCENEYK
jgi:hypothetical protein